MRILIIILLLGVLSLNGKSFLLTIDDGPNKHTTPIAKKLLIQEIPAIWFLTGTNLRWYKKEIGFLVSNNFVLGNHTSSHCISNYRRAMIEEIKGVELLPINNYLKSNFDYDIKYFRAPYGLLYNNLMVATIELKLVYVHWTLCPDNGKKDFYNALNNSSRELDIILIHSTKHNLDGLDQLITDLKKRGKFVDYSDIEDLFEN